ncbi:hypothetical protein CKM354_001016400 [Cercospora kikuchii]|uniref:non-specific serine/threonine protein kinase n=1 Tax=Cercospora kikuchii TaxID=84275 RepID=A0A9P3CQI5_9PEZI|nr:uncharacterized protein CKM354_001016400 [Cercospora kikuchii]GIZ47063.1 hypothetical protein CKM354_001016400 [Cercospora kikuchii]
MSKFTSKQLTVKSFVVTGSNTNSPSRPKTSHSPAQASELVVFPPFIDDHAATLNEHSKEQTSAEHTSRPTAVPSLKAIQQKSARPGIMSRVATAISGAVASVIGPGHPIIGPSPNSAVYNLEKTYEKNYFKHNTFREEQIGQGTEAEVYLLSNIDKPEVFAVKHTKATKLSKEQTKHDELPHEAKMLLQMILPHPRIVAAFDCLPDLAAPGRHKIYMEYCNAGSLAQQYTHWLSRVRSPMPEVFLLHVLVQGMEALAYLHSGLRYVGKGQYTQDPEHLPIVHADVKEEQFLLSWGLYPLPEIKLADFGTAKFEGQPRPNGLATLCYLAPEDVAICGLEPIKENAWAFHAMSDARTTASDIYAFGLMMYMFASREKKPAKIGTSPGDLRISREYDTPGLLELIQKMLAIDPAERAEASFHPVNGILPQIHLMREARDKLIGARRVPGPTEWAVPPPRGRHVRVCRIVDICICPDESCFDDDHVDGIDEIPASQNDSAPVITDIDGFLDMHTPSVTIDHRCSF